MNAVGERVDQLLARTCPWCSAQPGEACSGGGAHRPRVLAFVRSIEPMLTRGQEQLL